MLNKQLVKNNFSKAVNSYEEYAVVQDYMGQELIKQIELKREVNNILEIGAGTGLFTEKLLAKFADSHYLLVDISPAMIKKCQHKFAANNQIDYLTADAENMDLDQKFDLIVSNAVIQWFKNLGQTIDKFMSYLKDGGKLYLSTFGADHFQELTDCCNQVLGADFSQDFKSKKTLINNLNNYCSDLKVKEDEYIEKFSSVRQFLKATKKIGANSAKQNRPKLTPGKLRKIEEVYSKKYSQAGEIIVTHHLLFLELKK